jgi:hypothetical protein
VRDLDSGQEVVAVAGRHFDRKASTVLTLADGTAVSLPVWGSRRSKAVMVAQDQGATTLASFRLTGTRRAAVCEIVVPPTSLQGDDLLIVLALGGCLLRTYFVKPGA